MATVRVATGTGPSFYSGSAQEALMAKAREIVDDGLRDARAALEEQAKLLEQAAVESGGRIRLEKVKFRGGFTGYRVAGYNSDAALLAEIRALVQTGKEEPHVEG